ncbi:hypothetical protein EC991_008025 [Linnemannia zychae]|nr:hypothetical protein EC991_008025 [Linnemannia zychae]
MRFPFSGPMPAMPQKWIALMPCPVIAIESAETPESNLGQKRQQQEIGRNPSLPLDATAIVFYATAEANCHGVYSDINDNNDSLPPFMVLDAQSAQNLLLTLDNLSYGTTALAALSNTEADSKATETKVDSVSIEMDDDEKDESAEAGTENIGATLSPAGSFDMKEVPKSSSRPSRRQIVISIPEIASMVESFTTGAAIRARRVLVTLGLDTQDDADEKFINGCNDRSRIMDDASYYRPLTSSMLLKTGGGVGAQKACFELDSEIGLHEQDRLNRENDDDKGTGSVPPILQRHSKTRTRPNRLPQRGHPASHSQLLDQVQSLMLLKEYPHHRGHQSIHHRLNPLHYNNNNLPLTHPNNTTLSGKVAMVLMSTVCGIGVGMFGALLFVVALKVRLFQSRRSNNSGGHLRNATAAQQQQAHQQLRESGLKKVIPLGVLESYGVQTVLQTSSATTILTAVSEKSKAKMALLSKGPKAYAENVIEMEEGLEDAEARENARRQRLERRRRLSGSGQLGLGRRIEENENENEEEEDSSSEEDSDDSNEDSGDADDSGSVEVHNRYRVLEHYSDYDYEEEGDQVVPVMRSTRGGLPDGGAMNMEQITAAIMTATGQGSYRRVSYSRQGHLNDSTTSLSSSYSTSSSSSSSGSSSGSSSSSRSMERALTSSFSSSLARTAEDPRGCTHSVTHSHQRKTTRKKQKSGTKTKKAETKTELPFANANAQTMCSICLAEYEVGEQVRTLPCYHQYHQGCIDPWLLNVAALCPICKRDLFPHGSAPPS